MSTKVAPKKKTSVVIVGAGVSASIVLKELSANPHVEVTLIQAQSFKEAPWGGPTALPLPEEHYKFVDESPFVGCKVVSGLAESISEGSVSVGGQQVPFDFLVAATGFSMPGVLTKPGQSLEERRAHINAIWTAIHSGKNVVIGGAGIVAVELAANIAEALAKKGPLKPGHVTLLAGSKLLPTYPPRVQTKAAAVLKQLGVAVILDRATGMRELTLAGAEGSVGGGFEVALESGAPALAGVGAYLPAFVAGAHTGWLTGVALSGGRVAVDEHLRSTSHPKVFALGGCAKIDDSFLGIVKMAGQAKTVAANIKATIEGKALTKYAEAEPSMTNAPAVHIGRSTFAAFVPEVMGPPGNLVLCCGPPCNLLCPCVACVTCCAPCLGCPDLCWACPMCCGLPCSQPEGRATAVFFRELYASGIFPKNALGWVGLGAKRPVASKGGAPEISDMARE